YVGFAIGFGIYVPQFAFLWKIFGPAAIALWAVLAFWLGLFLLLAHKCWRRMPLWASALLIPLIWTGLEYFRSELYYLRFSWLSAGYAFSNADILTGAAWLGVYGIGFVLMLCTALL